MKTEIGSEFWKVEIGGDRHLITNSSYIYLLSGRTALDYIIRDIKYSKAIKSVYMPSYCCHSMVKPFIDNEVKIKYYNVYFEKGNYTYELDLNVECDVILILQYFGFYNEAVGKAINFLNNRGKIIIEDATHSWFCDNPFHENSDYVFASLRKWTGLVCGAVAVKKEGKFLIKYANDTNNKYIQLRTEAANLKEKYMIDQSYEMKNKFLKLFNDAEEILENDYKDYGVPHNIINQIKVIDNKKVREARRLNAKLLIEGLKCVDKLKIVELKEGDVPLFVPILVSNGYRDKLQQYLIANKVYCPVHWPLSPFHLFKDNRNLYDNCLSLICDQRYGKSEMDKIICLIKDFFREEV